MIIVCRSVEKTALTGACNGPKSHLGIQVKSAGAVGGGASGCRFEIWCVLFCLIKDGKIVRIKKQIVKIKSKRTRENENNKNDKQKHKKKTREQEN